MIPPRNAAPTGGTLPTVSVVVPLYNKERHIRQCLASALEQSGVEFEIVVVDDGSTDGSAALVESVGDPRLRLVRQANGGVSRARNTGLAAARAPLVAFLDADDWWLPGHLAQLVALAADHPACDLFASAFVSSDGPGAESRDAAPRYLDWPAFLECMLQGQDPVWTSAILARRAPLLEEGGFMVGANHGEDVAVWLRLARRGGAALHPGVGAVYRRTPDGLSARLVRGPDACMRTIDGLLAGPAGPSDRAGLAELRNRYALTHAITAGLHGDRQVLREFLSVSRSTRRYRHRWYALRALAVLPGPLIRAVFALHLGLRRRPLLPVRSRVARIKP